LSLTRLSLGPFKPVEGLPKFMPFAIKRNRFVNLVSHSGCLSDAINSIREMK
jgi:hypothetical protein